jgi:hypothetical protein
MRLGALTVAALVAGAPAAALAEPAESANWTIGAGIQAGGYVLLPSQSTAVSTIGLVPLGSTVVPAATLFLERRVGDRTWLVLGWTGSVNRTSADPPSPQSSFAVITKDDTEVASVSAGLRRVVTGPGAIVDVSLQATVEGGYFHEVQRLTAPDGTETETHFTGGYTAVNGGIAVERELTNGLAVRISTPLVSASWSKVTTSDAAASRHGESSGVALTLAPRIELRLAF